MMYTMTKVSVLTLLYCFITVISGGGIAYTSDEVPAPQQNEPIVLTGGTVYTVDGDIIENGMVVFSNGVISAVGRNVPVPVNARVIDVSGKFVYPGLIEAESALGLNEISAVPATVDVIEKGEINPNVRAERAVNSDSERIPVTRANGIALAVSVPEGGLVSGMSALMMLDGWTWESMVLKAPVGLVVRWPTMVSADTYGAAKEREGHRKQVAEQRSKIEEAFKDARSYMNAKTGEGSGGIPAHDTDVRWEAMMPVLRGELPVFVHAQRRREIETAIEWADREKLRMVLVGGLDAPLVTDLLREKDIPVIVTPVLQLPLRRDDPYDAPYTVAKRLHDAGVRFCIAGGSGHGNERNLPYHAAQARAFGLPDDIALRAVTLSVAEILGVGDRTGSITAGKDATIIVTDGDPLEIRTHVEQLFIQGRDVPLTSRHTRLYDKYRERYRRLNGAQ